MALFVLYALATVGAVPAPDSQRGRSAMNTRVLFPLLLMGFWVFMAWRAFSHGDWTLAMVFFGTGIVLTAWRLNSARV
jgi:hypothetical protein